MRSGSCDERVVYHDVRDAGKARSTARASSGDRPSFRECWDLADAEADAVDMADVEVSIAGDAVKPALEGMSGKEMKRRLRDVTIDMFPGSNAMHPIYYAGRVYFNMDDGASGKPNAELWASDLTAAGTALVADINEDEESYPHSMAVLNGRLYFAAEGDRHGKELYVSDGTAGGTRLLADVNPGDDHGYVQQLVACRGLLYFGAEDGEHGFELWRSDGRSAEGTAMVADLTPGPGDSALSSLRCDETNERLTFVMGSGKDGGGGIKEWRTDGTAEGTRPLL